LDESEVAIKKKTIE